MSNIAMLYIYVHFSNPLQIQLLNRSLNVSLSICAVWNDMQYTSTPELEKHVLSTDARGQRYEPTLFALQCYSLMYGYIINTHTNKYIV